MGIIHQLANCQDCGMYWDDYTNSNARKQAKAQAIFWDCENKEEGDQEAIERAKQLLSDKSPDSVSDEQKHKC